MKTKLRLVAALALVVVGVTTTGSAEAEDPVSSYLSIDVEVVGTPPPGATITLLHSLGTGYTPDEFPVTLAELSDGPEVVDFAVTDIGHGVWVDPTDDGDADAIDYSCTTNGVNGSIPAAATRCDELAPSEPFPALHAYVQFWGQQPGRVGGYVAERSDITVTLTYDPPQFCAGEPVTVDWAAGEAATPGPDVILGTDDNNVINGGGGNDLICGAGGNDRLRGGAGRDRLIGGRGADRLEGGASSDTLLGERGDDVLFGGAGPDVLNGGAQRDTCDGGTERDTATACEVRRSIP